MSLEKLIGKISLLSFLAITLQSCNTGIDKSNSAVPLQNTGNIEICRKEYLSAVDANGRESWQALNDASPVPINTQIRLYFNNILDRYSPYPFNFELYSEDGIRFAGKLVVDPPPDPANKFQPPQGDPCYRGVTNDGFNGRVDYLTISFDTLAGTYLIPNRQWYLSMRDRPSNNQQGGAQPVGIQAIDGARLQYQTVRFKSGPSDQILGLSGRNRLEVMSFGPGIMLNDKDQNVRLDSIIDVTKIATVTPNAPVYLTFSEPFRHLVFDQGVSNENLRAIPPTPVENFVGFSVGVVSSAAQVGQILANVPNAVTQPAAWGQFLHSNFYNALDGTIESADRRTIIFRPRSPYPDTTIQAVITLAQGFISRDRLRAQRYSVFIGGFIHSSGASTDFGFQDPVDMIFRRNQ